MGIIQSKVTPEFKKWVGYCEKNSAAQVGTYDNPENYTKNAGNNNYTVFAKLYKQKTGINIQGQPWCDCLFDSILIHLFGVDMAKVLVGGFSAYTPTSASYYKKMGRYFKDPKEGDQIFFHNGTRIYHTGYVYKVDSKYVYTVEGNTSSTAVLENDGGCVAYKKYPLGWTDGKRRIDGYGRPDYSLVEVYTEGFMRAADNVRWWYQFKDGRYAIGWNWLTEKTSGTSGWYFFDPQGYMVTGYTDIDGKKYILCPDKNVHEGQCMISDDSGALGFVEKYDFEKHVYVR